MSDNIPLDLQVEIMERLPVKSLLQFRSVSKAWKSLIDSPPFIVRYRGRQHILVSRWDHKLLQYKYDYIVDDDDTFPHQRVSITLPQCVEMLGCHTIIGDSEGLFCLHNYLNGYDDHITKAVIWNPSIRKAVSVDLPIAVAVVASIAQYLINETRLVFGVCRETSDPKIVKIAYRRRWMDKFSISGIPWKVDVFRLSTGSWRTLCSSNYLSRKSIRFNNDYNMVVIDGVHYCRAKERITMDGDESRYHKLIVSFDLTTEEFGEVNLPDSVACKHILSIYELSGSLAVLQHSVEANDPFYIVWMMEKGVSKSFTKLFTFNSHTLDLPEFYVMGFRKSGDLIIQIDTYGTHRFGTLAVYEPYSKSLNYIVVNEQDMPHYVYIPTWNHSFYFEQHIF